MQGELGRWRRGARIRNRSGNRRWGKNQRGQSRDGRQMWRQDRYTEWETKIMGDWEAEWEGRVGNRERNQETEEMMKS